VFDVKPAPLEFVSNGSFLLDLTRVRNEDLEASVDIVVKLFTITTIATITVRENTQQMDIETENFRRDSGTKDFRLARHGDNCWRIVIAHSPILEKVCILSGPGKDRS
jgi:hypothetical protein